MKSISRKGTAAGGGCALYLFASVFFVAGSVVFVFFSGVPLWRWVGAQSWETVPCVIESSSVGSHSDSDGTTYSIRIRYSYVWEGQTYRGDAYNFFSGSSSGRSGKQKVVDQYPSRSERVCYVNPSDPGDAVLSRDFSLGYLIGCFGLLFVAVAVGVVFAARRSGSNASISRGGRVQAAAAPARAYGEGRVTLKSGSSSVVGCGVMLFVAAFWNGIVGTVLWGVLSDGDVDIFPLLFMIPFVLVGLVLVLVLFYMFLALFNPRPDLTLDPGYLPLGGTSVLGWSFRGSTSRIRRLTITLRGEEKATYRRGTNSVTDTSVFYELVLVDTEAPNEMPVGEISFTVPEFTAPSFDAPNNKIVWVVKVSGDIRRWPDVNAEFPLEIAPLPVEGGGARVPAEFRAG